MTELFDPFDPDFQRDPYPFYRVQRTLDPIHRHALREDFDVFWLTRHADVVSVLKDPRFSASKVPPPMRAALEAADPATLPTILRLMLDAMLVRDPPEHTRLRNLVSRAFTPRIVEKLAPRIDRIANELVDGVVARGELDVIRDLAGPLPVIVICELMGFPAADHARIKRWSDDVAPMLDGTLREENMPRIAAAADRIAEYTRAILADRRRSPRDDLLSQLQAAHVADDRLTENELVATVVLVLGAGHETTTNLIGNGLLALAEHPDELRRLDERPQWIASAVEEVLRFDGPVQVTSRTPVEDVELGGVVLPAGKEVDLVLGAANRDPAVFADPERFDIARTPNPHVAFGHGVHFCLGANLARIEAQVAIATVLRRLDGLALDPEGLVRRPGIVLRGLERFPLAFDAVRSRARRG